MRRRPSATASSPTLARCGRVLRVPDGESCCPNQQSGLLVVRPHPENLHGPFLFHDLVNEPMLNINASRVCAREITDELLEPWRLTPRVLPKNLEKFFAF